MVSNIKKFAISVSTVLKILFLIIKKHSKNEVEKLTIWRHFLRSCKHRVYPFFNICVLSFSNKKYIITGLVNNFLMHLVRRWHFFCRKENTIRYSISVYCLNSIETTWIIVFPHLFNGMKCVSLNPPIL